MSHLTQIEQMADGVMQVDKKALLECRGSNSGGHKAPTKALDSRNEHGRCDKDVRLWVPVG